ncbi:MAG: hypothetical protein PHS34_08625 [Candidatus Omnitrophica bacterium]|nr:hypothetical protein [Candidatus Omnitrophota bacterium]
MLLKLHHYINHNEIILVNPNEIRSVKRLKAIDDGFCKTPARTVVDLIGGTLHLVKEYASVIEKYANRSVEIISLDNQEVK